MASQKPKSTKARATRPHPKAWLQARATLSNAMWLLEWQAGPLFDGNPEHEATHRALSILQAAYFGMLEYPITTKAVTQ